MNETNLENFNPIERHDIAIEGMTCEKCIGTVEKALRQQRGVKDVRVDRENALATVTFDRRETHLPDLHDALLKAGYKPMRMADADRLAKPTR